MCAVRSPAFISVWSHPSLIKFKHAWWVNAVLFYDILETGNLCAAIVYFTSTPAFQWHFHGKAMWEEISHCRMTLRPFSRPGIPLWKGSLNWLFGCKWATTYFIASPESWWFNDLPFQQYFETLRKGHFPQPQCVHVAYEWDRVETPWNCRQGQEMEAWLRPCANLLAFCLNRMIESFKYKSASLRSTQSSSLYWAWFIFHAEIPYFVGKLVKYKEVCIEDPAKTPFWGVILKSSSSSVLQAFRFFSWKMQKFFCISL